MNLKCFHPRKLLTMRVTIFMYMGSAHDKTIDNSGWYPTENYVFNGVNKPTGYAYTISLSGKGYGKEDAVITAIQGKLSGYKKDENKSYDDESVYSDGKKEIKLFKKRGNIMIVISAVTSEEATDEEVVEEYG